MSDEVLAVVRASGPRRAFGVAVLTALGILLICLIFAVSTSGLLVQGLLIVVGGAALWGAARMWQASSAALELTVDVLRTSDGVVLATTGDIAAIDRGIFAFKPSNGFTLKLARPARASWTPGLYWRLGRRLGVGGVTSAAQTRMMADVISAMLAKR